MTLLSVKPPTAMRRFPRSAYGCIPVAPFLFAVCIGFAGCTGDPSTEAIVDRAIKAHGGERFRHSEVTFAFRGDRYRIWRDGGRFRYEHRYRDSTGEVVDVLANDTLFRTVDGERESLSAGERSSVLSTVNSVVYFALLPFRLEDPAVQTRDLGETEIRGQPYHEIEVTFRREGGGAGWQDRFVYWIHREQYTMDYLAYHYHTDGGGTRFREAVNRRRIGGLLLSDYRNYTSAAIDTAVEEYDRILETRPETLELVSEIRMAEIEVSSTS